MSNDIPKIQAIKANLKKISPWIIETPVLHHHSDGIQQLVGGDTQLYYKLELFQQTGSFKARGALTTLINMDKDDLAHGVVAASAGNHAIAVSYAAKMLGTTAKVVMPKVASPIRIQRCKDFGATVILVDSFVDAFQKMQEIAEREGRIPVHPFEGPWIALGTASIGLEIAQQVPDVEAILVPVGGGGLIAGIGAAIKQLLPNCKIYGIEPEGADVMCRSFEADECVELKNIQTIAGSLSVPRTMPYSFSLCKKFVDEMVRVSDEAIVEAMRIIFYEIKLAVEPAAAITIAAACGPLRKKLQGKRVALVISGTNIDTERYCKFLNGDISNSQSDKPDILQKIREYFLGQ